MVSFKLPPAAWMVTAPACVSGVGASDSDIYLICLQKMSRKPVSSATFQLHKTQSPASEESSLWLTAQSGEEGSGVPLEDTRTCLGDFGGHAVESV